MTVHRLDFYEDVTAEQIRDAAERVIAGQGDHVWFKEVRRQERFRLGRSGPNVRDHALIRPSAGLPWFRDGEVYRSFEVLAHIWPWHRRPVLDYRLDYHHFDAYALSIGINNLIHEEIL